VLGVEVNWLLVGCYYSSFTGKKRSTVGCLGWVSYLAGRKRFKLQDATVMSSGFKSASRVSGCATRALVELASSCCFTSLGSVVKVGTP